MFETNTQNNSSLLSLARAAQLTGYHQDYLGQLCRLGKLPATKVGRNWFTSEEALNKLSAGIQTETEKSEAWDELFDSSVDSVPQPSVAAPELEQTVTISRVAGMPIAIRTIPHRIQNVNTVQSLITTMRIESLQKEVLELRQLLSRLMTEVAAHTNILQNKEFFQQRTDNLKHSYAANFDFNAPMETSRASENSNYGEKARAAMWPQKDKRKYAVVSWVAVGGALAVVLFILAGISSNNFLGESPTVSTHYYRTQMAQFVNGPAVAGVESAQEVGDELPTTESGISEPFVIQ
jgi:hypothetical protein